MCMYMCATPKAGRLQVADSLIMAIALIRIRLRLWLWLWLCIRRSRTGVSGASAAWLRVGLVDERGI